MKRFIHASSESEINFDFNVSPDYNIDLDDMQDRILDVLEDTGAAEYASSVTVNLGTLSVCDIRVFSRGRTGQCRVTGDKEPSQKCVDTLIRKLYRNLPEFVERNEKELRYKGTGKAVLSPQAVLHRILKQQFGLKPTFSYSESHKTQYMLWSLPFADNKNGKLDIKQGQQLAEKVESFIEDFVANHPWIDIQYSLPLGGSTVYAAWTFKSTGNDSIFDKEIDDYIEA